jgi:glycosyltransferase 2 family protein
VSRAAALRIAFGALASGLVFGLILRFIARNGGAPSFADLELPWALGAVLLTMLQIALVAGRWAFFSRELGASIDYSAALGAYFVSVFLNQLLPLGILGDALRGVWHARRLRSAAATVRPAVNAATALILDRASGQLTLLVIVLSILPLWWQPLGDAARGAAFSFDGKVLFLALLAALTVLGLCSYFWRSALRHTARARHIFFGARGLAAHGACSAISVALLVGAFECTARALGFPLHFGLALRVIPLVLAASSLPSFALGTGAREVSAAALYHLLGLRAAEGAAIGLGFGLLGLVASLPGLLVLVLARMRSQPNG